MVNASKQKKKNLLYPALFAITLFFALLFAIKSDTSAVVTRGLSLFVVSVLPSLFPYFFLTAIMSMIGLTSKMSKVFSPITTRLFNVNGLCGYAFFMSVISGYPVGAQVVADLKEQNLISPVEAVRAQTFCSTSSPMFLIGCVGDLMFGNRLFGVLLFICNLLTAIIVGIIFSFYHHEEKPSFENAQISFNRCDNLLDDCAYKTAISILKVGTLIVVFYILLDALTWLKVLAPLEGLFSLVLGDKIAGKALSLGLFECTIGYTTLASGGITKLALPICAVFCGFGGLSAITQSLTALKRAKIKTAPFILAKVLSAVIGFLLGLLFNFFL